MTLDNQGWVHRRSFRVGVFLLAFAAVLTLPGDRAQSAFIVPTGFTDSLVATLSSGTAMDFAPDGRLFVCQQGGALRIIKNGALLGTAFVNISVDSNGERGLLGVAIDPNFPTDPYVYVYYTVPTGSIHNRVSRFTATGDIGGSEVVLLELDNLSGATNHNGGAIHFGSDGHLYIAVGDNANATNAEVLTTLHGKMLRIESDGGIPTNNPFDAQTTGNRKAIWAMGLRNPFTFSFQPGTGRMFINDVGAGTTEEINDGIAGSNYGWNTCEGPCNPPNANFRDPIYWYANDATTCAITGGAFYNPTTVQFPTEYVGNYFFADFCGGWIRKLDPANGNAVTNFATSISSAVDLKVSSNGSLYYLTRSGGGAVRRIDYPANMVGPTINPHPSNQTVGTGDPATFTVGATGPSPYTYQWQRNNVDIPGETSSSYTLANAQPTDNGAMFRAMVTNAFGSATSNNATLTVNLIPLEADVAPRPDGSGAVVVSDWVQVGRFSVALDTASVGTEFQRADCAPRATLGDGQITVADWVQAGRYSVNLDPSVPAGGPTSGSFAPQVVLNDLPSMDVASDAYGRAVRVVDAEFTRGQTGTLEIELEAMGNENALAFSLIYDPNKAAFIDARVANRNASDYRLLVNTKQTDAGRIGFVLALPTGRTFAAGTRELLTLRFVPVGGGEATTTTMDFTFNDSVIRREIVTADAVRLPLAKYSAGTVVIKGHGLAIVSAASYQGGTMARESIAAAFGVKLSKTNQNAPAGRLPVRLGSTSVTVRDSAGVEREAPLFFVSEHQVNFQIPKETALGMATVVVASENHMQSAGIIRVVDVAPGLFAVNTFAAGDVFRLGPDGQGMFEPLSEYDAAAESALPVPIDLGRLDDVVYLVLYGTGFRNRQSLEEVVVKIDGVSAVVEYAGPQGTMYGLDQMNIILPRQLAGRGKVWIEFTVDEIAANLVNVHVK